METNVLMRLEKVLSSPEQINHKILISFISTCIADKEKMRTFCKTTHGLSDKQFNTNFDKMKTEKGKPHGEYFNEDNNEVRLNTDILKSILTILTSKN